ncbi:MAG TPA: hypothetical protein VK501_25165 [Baekduia sp.]|uniref:putative quinol monooxygenase n=1 Tax=Baekduia sp. TaxID=2600305 RepID=UPI002BC596DF|nr:hypothetical protein [Baekduia sp.]HMJ37219.1 hypothetical protein [Baekduia sp.]
MSPSEKVVVIATIQVKPGSEDEALDAHTRTPHLKELFGKVGPLVSAPPSIIRTSALPIGDPGKGALRAAH